MLKILNLGCGNNPMQSTPEIEYVNADAYPRKAGIFHCTIRKPPLVFLNKETKENFTFNNGTFDRIYFFHTIEYIPEEHHGQLLGEFRRMLKPGGNLCISYPEFEQIAKNWLANKNGQRDFWKRTIYGRGTTEWDRHKALMHTPDFIRSLGLLGFKVISAKSEKGQPFNTMLIATPSEPTLTYETLLAREVESAPGT